MLYHIILSGPGDTSSTVCFVKIEDYHSTSSLRFVAVIHSFEMFMDFSFSQGLYIRYQGWYFIALLGKTYPHYVKFMIVQPV